MNKMEIILNQDQLAIFNMRLKKWKEYLLKKVRKRAITHIASCPVLSYFKVLKWILQKGLEDTCFLNDIFF